eukprot:104569_1
MSSLKTRTMTNIDSDHIKEAHKIVKEPFDYLFAEKGKGMRAMLMDAYQLWYKIPEDTLNRLKEVIEILHTASLLVDDIEDGSLYRRGKPVAHTIYGVPSTINSSTYMLFDAIDKVRGLKNESATACFLEEIKRLHQGQGMDIFWRDRNQCPSETDYIQMVLNKTAAMFRLASSLLKSFSSESIDLTNLSNLFGIFFQIRDDVVSLTDDEYMKKSKVSFCEDVGEGKFSFCIIHSIRSNPDSHQLLNILKMRTPDNAIRKQAVDYMESTGSFEYSKKVLRSTKEEILDELSSLGGNTIIEKMLEKLTF